MSFDTLARTAGRQPIVIVEMDLDYCPNTYGVAPCTAVLGVTGVDKCFNTCASCQDPTNYARTPVKTYRFSSQVLPVNAPLSIPTLRTAKVTPARIDPGQGLGVRASAEFSFADHPFSDLGIDKYARERAYNSATRGTFWGKFFARNQYYQSRPLRMITGYLNADGSYDAANMETRLYFIEGMTGPDRSGQVKVTAKDILKLVDDARSQVPPVSSGQLLADISTGATTATLLPVGVGDDEYPASGLAMIGSECVSFTRTADVLTLLRAQQGTAASAHTASDAVQVCKQYIDTPVADIVYDLLTTYGGIDPSYIDKTAWDAEAEEWLPQHNLSAVIEKPTGLNTLLGELSSQALFYIWWDEKLQKIPFQAIKPARDEDVTSINTDDHLLFKSVNLEEDPEQRISEVWVYFGRVSLAEGLDKVSNWARLVINDDVDAESDNQFGEQRIKKVFSRWLPITDPIPALLLSARLIARYRNNPRALHVELDAKNHALWTGGIARVTCRAVLDFTGAPLETDMMVVEVAESKNGTTYKYELGPTFFAGRYGFVAPADVPDYSLATAAQKRRYAFVSPDIGVFADGGKAYKVI